jgi:hypothetical protein
VDQTLGVIVGAVAVLLGSALTGLLSPWVARVWQRSDKKISDAQAREALLRAAIEEYVNALRDTDMEFSSTVMAKSPTAMSEAAGRTLSSMQAIQRSEARVGLLLTGAEVPIAQFMDKVSITVVKRQRGEGHHTSQMTNLRSAVVSGSPRGFGARRHRSRCWPSLSSSSASCGTRRLMTRARWGQVSLRFESVLFFAAKGENPGRLK